MVKNSSPLKKGIEKAEDWLDWKAHVGGRKLQAHLATLSAGLLIGVLALMTFLLSVGLQHPKTDLSVSLYLAISLLGLNLVVYGVSAGVSSAGSAKAIRIIQQVCFTLSVLAVVGFALTASHVFFDIPQASPSSATGAAEAAPAQ